ncbi:YkgJ family cysteine cluster protein [Neptuniibacter sp. QD34_54]|uniref:YkgJ family cysteine cluster protein n=1 Tax=unclassified Neptuniibacter TaxID=2630693 RepID=UPI0039F6AF1A
MPETDVFFSTADVTDVAQKLQQVTAEYEALFGNLSKQIYSSIDHLDHPSDEIAVTLQYVNDASQAFRQNFGDNSKIACSKGCHHCCHFPIQVPQQTISDISHHLKSTLAPAELAELTDKLEQNIAARQAPLFRAPCPFLDEEGACSIYHHRPLSCRWFSSPDAHICEQSVHDGRDIQQHPVQSRIYQAASDAVLAKQKKLTGSDQQLPFIPALLEALQSIK